MNIPIAKVPVGATVRLLTQKEVNEGRQGGAEAKLLERRREQRPAGDAVISVFEAVRGFMLQGVKIEAGKKFSLASPGTADRLLAVVDEGSAASDAVAERNEGSATSLARRLRQKEVKLHGERVVPPAKKAITKFFAECGKPKTPDAKVLAEARDADAAFNELKNMHGGGPDTRALQG